MSNIVIDLDLDRLVLSLLGFATRYAIHFARSVMLIWVVLAPALVGLGRMCLRIVQRGLLRRGIGVAPGRDRRVERSGATNGGEHCRGTVARIANDRFL